MSVTKEDQANMTPLEYLKATNHPDSATAQSYMEQNKHMGTMVLNRIYAGIQAGHYKMTHPPSMLGKDIYIFGDKIETGPMREMLSTPYGKSSHFTPKMTSMFSGGKKTRRRRHNKKQKKSKMSKKSKKSRKTRKTRKTRRRRH